MNFTQSLNQPEILLVDDTPEHIETAVTVLRENNFRVRIATKGSTAFKLIEQHQPDLILLDVYMPEMDGFEICRIIKTESDFSSIPIIFLTSSNDAESIKKGFDLGAQDYVVKPFNTSELLARVHTHIKLKKQTESLLKANHELDSFCYTVAHDLKAPLLSLSKLTEYLDLDYSDRLNNEGRELIDNIQDKSKEIIQLVDHLLELSRMSEMPMNIEPINLEQLFWEVYAELIKLEPQRDVKFTIQHLPTIQGDSVMIKLLVMNVLSNALKYTRNRKEASIEATAMENEAEFIISIKDNGAGFDMRYASRLFSVFQRLHSQNEFEGSGVGLAIVQKILKRHHGLAWMTGKVDEGATFYFSFRKD
ncbi:response regulator [Desulfosporosinus metallidurans]|uniref:Stage 0 sporulation protein A homolog n=1 Tax=Desulfosporosinus metallidurans TaxID=1888891 RepID=A0A1Q8QXI0_9FIRM|nr:response regulator [Desulfosporosinus metallidurans]OLN32005.1 response regulator receiver (CheY-like) modulated metal dependent phosphohydrolase [Desulfosporosinus metallidurans]